jgi:hypothetical protein
MKYIKKFETITDIKVGDYILIPDYEARILSWKHQELGTFLKKQVLQV